MPITQTLPSPAPRPYIGDDGRPHGEENPPRKPDGVPHSVVGLTAFGAVLIALGMAITYYYAGPIAAVFLTFVIVVFSVVRLSRRAERERIDQEANHPDEHSLP